MPEHHNESRAHALLQEVELTLQYLAKPENLTSPDSEYIRAITAQYALQKLQLVMNQIEAA